MGSPHVEEILRVLVGYAAAYLHTALKSAESQPRLREVGFVVLAALWVKYDDVPAAEPVSLVQLGVPGGVALGDKVIHSLRARVLKGRADYLLDFAVVYIYAWSEFHI